MSVPYLEQAEQSARPRSGLASWPWITATVLSLCFAAACWQWWGPQPWYTTSEAEVSALVGRISEGQANRQIGFFALGVYGAALLATPSRRVIQVRPIQFYLLLTFLAWAFFSPVWSVDKSQTLKRLIVFAATCTAIAGVIKHYDIRQMAQIAFIASGLAFLYSLGYEAHAVATAFPGMGHYRFGGMLHPNHAALNCTIIILSALYLHRIEGHRWVLLVALAAVVALILTKSRTAVMAAGVAAVVYLLLAATSKRALLALMLCAWMGVGAFILDSLQMLPSFKNAIAMGRTDLKKQDPREMTGRTAIWSFAIMQGNKDPNRAFVGYGYESFWTPTNARAVSDVVKFKISEGHNVYLDWFLELGLVGSSLYVMLLLWALARWTIASRLLASPSCAIAAGILAGAIVHGLAESSLGDASLPTFFFYTSIALSTLARPDEMEVA